MQILVNKYTDKTFLLENKNIIYFSEHHVNNYSQIAELINVGLSEFRNTDVRRPIQARDCKQPSSHR
jgi:hypothetical protein